MHTRSAFYRPVYSSVHKIKCEDWKMRGKNEIMASLPVLCGTNHTIVFKGAVSKIRK
jgi:hypothetical protein